MCWQKLLLCAVLLQNRPHESSLKDGFVMQYAPNDKVSTTGNIVVKFLKYSKFRLNEKCLLEKRHLIWQRCDWFPKNAQMMRQVRRMRNEEHGWLATEAPMSTVAEYRMRFEQLFHARRFGQCAQTGEMRCGWIGKVSVEIRILVPGIVAG